MHKYAIYYKLNGEYYTWITCFLYPKRETAISWFKWLHPFDKIICVYKVTLKQTVQ